jgi:glyoxylase-like metal-dependent hydrolase (beta-lactamase superfamily II)
VDDRLFPLPAETLVLPGHGLDTTIGTERPRLAEWVERGW